MVRNAHTQTMDILNHLKTHGSITSMEAFSLFRATRLSGIIFNLRQYGYIIDTVLVECISSYDTKVRYAKYIYRGEE